MEFSLFKFARRDEAPELVAVPATPPRGTGVPVEWYAGEDEGQLAVDVYDQGEALVVCSTIAGVKPEDLEVTLNNDVITIRGRRERAEAVSPEHYFYQECYWGAFSRSIVLPVEVRPDGVQASLKNGVLTVLLPKAPKGIKSVLVEVAPE